MPLYLQSPAVIWPLKPNHRLLEFLQNCLVVSAEGSKIAVAVGMLLQPQGATLPSIMAATDWQPHTVRGFISTLGKKPG